MTGCPAVSFLQYDGERVAECQKREDRQGPLCCPNQTASTRGVVQHLVESGRSVSHSKTRNTGKVVGVQSSDCLSDELKLWVRATEVPKYRVRRKTEVLSSRVLPVLPLRVYPGCRPGTSGPSTKWTTANSSSSAAVPVGHIRVMMARPDVRSASGVY